MTRQFCQQWGRTSFYHFFYHHYYAPQSCHFREFCRVFSSCTMNSSLERVLKCLFVRSARSLTFVLSVNTLDGGFAVAFWTHYRADGIKAILTKQLQLQFFNCPWDIILGKRNSRLCNIAASSRDKQLKLNRCSSCNYRGRTWNAAPDLTSQIGMENWTTLIDSGKKRILNEGATWIWPTRGQAIYHFWGARELLLEARNYRRNWNVELTSR